MSSKWGENSFDTILYSLLYLVKSLISTQQNNDQRSRGGIRMLKCGVSMHYPKMKISILEWTDRKYFFHCASVIARGTKGVKSRTHTHKGRLLGNPSN